MDAYIDRMIRRLVLMGVPLLSGGCWLTGSSCPDNPRPVSEVVEIENPALRMDGGFPLVTAAAYDRCVDALDCKPLCVEAIPLSNILSCDRVPTDGFASGDERVAVEALFIPICEGRRPEGQGAPPPPRKARGDVGSWLARAAFLEGVSIPAFRRLAVELAAHGAPRSLVRRARRAARDEIRHHRIMTALAGRFGAEPQGLPARFPTAVRPLVDVAAENAAEGCVRETVGAIVGREQALRARDPVVRACMRGIARDESEHADLAFCVDGWSRTRLSRAARVRVDAAATTEIEAVVAETRLGVVTPTLTCSLGLPDARSNAEMVAGIRQLMRKGPSGFGTTLS